MPGVTRSSYFSLWLVNFNQSAPLRFRRPRVVSPGKAKYGTASASETGSYRRRPKPTGPRISFKSYTDMNEIHSIVYPILYQDRHRLCKPAHVADRRGCRFLESHEWWRSGAAALTPTPRDGSIDSAALKRSCEHIALFNECARLHLNNEFRK